MTSHIPCDAHDYFEIVCMRRSLIKVTTYNNQEYKGVPYSIDIIDRKEILKIETYQGSESIRLTDIIKLQAIGNKVTHHNFCVEW